MNLCLSIQEHNVTVVFCVSKQTLLYPRSHSTWYVDSTFWEQTLN